MTCKVILFCVFSLLNFKESNAMGVDSLPLLHSFKNEEVDTVMASYRDQTIAVKLHTGAVYIYQKDDWNKEYDAKLIGMLQHAMDLLSRIFTKVENPPSFWGGPEAWDSYIQDICSRNKRLIRKEGPATIAVQFIVDNAGEKYNVQLISPAAPPGLGALAVKLIQDSPAWIPATQNGHIVIAYKMQKIEFK